MNQNTAIMSLAPFTSAGVKQKTTELYALSDAALAVEANSVKTDFRLWMTNNFILDSTQTTYLNNLSDDATNYLGGQSAFCFVNRLPIILIEGTPAPGLTKWVHTENTAKIAANDNGDFSAEGTFIIKIVYE